MNCFNGILAHLSVPGQLIIDHWAPNGNSMRFFGAFGAAVARSIRAGGYASGEMLAKEGGVAENYSKTHGS